MSDDTEKAEPDTLLPCPFCGSDAEFERAGNFRQSCIIACTDCGCRLETGEVFRQGEQWNTRAAPPRCDAQRASVVTAAKALLAEVERTSDVFAWLAPIADLKLAVTLSETKPAQGDARSEEQAP